MVGLLGTVEKRLRSACIAQRFCIKISQLFSMISMHSTGTLLEFSCSSSYASLNPRARWVVHRWAEWNGRHRNDMAAGPAVRCGDSLGITKFTVANPKRVAVSCVASLRSRPDWYFLDLVDRSGPTRRYLAGRQDIIGGVHTTNTVGLGRQEKFQSW